MKYIPAILMLLAFLLICLGVFMVSQHNLLGLPVMIGGMMGELIFIFLNRMLRKNAEKEK